MDGETEVNWIFMKWKALQRVINVKWTQIAIERKWENDRYLLEHEMELLFPIERTITCVLMNSFQILGLVSI